MLGNSYIERLKILTNNMYTTMNKYEPIKFSYLKQQAIAGKKLFLNIKKKVSW